MQVRSRRRWFQTLMLPIDESCDAFRLGWTRTGPRGGVPIVVLPGGPGMASLIPYLLFRWRAARRGFDVIMMDHRGVGFSAKDVDGKRLRPEAITVSRTADDLAALLEHLEVERAVIVGSSYGSYLAQTFAVRHPDMVYSLILDSPLLSVEEDLRLNREHWRRLLWEGEPAGYARIARMLRKAPGRIDDATISHAVQVLHEQAGPQVLERFLLALGDGKLRWLWRQIAALRMGEVGNSSFPYIFEPVPVSRIAFAELGYGVPPDGHPLDPQLAYVEASRGQPHFEGEPQNLCAAAPNYPWPVAVISGEWDLTTTPAVATRLARLAPHGVLVPISRMGHAVLDSHQLALFEVIQAMLDGRSDKLPERAHDLSALPRRGIEGLVGWLLRKLVG